MVRGHVVGHVVEDQADAPFSELRSCDGKAARPTESVVNDVIGDTVWGADHVLRPQVRQRRAVAGVQRRIRERDRKTDRASLPDAHQPDRIHL